MRRLPAAILSEFAVIYLFIDGLAERLHLGQPREALVIDTVVCLTLAKWETVSGRFGGYLIWQGAK